jgi:peptidylprolyl isomerase
MLVLTRRAGEKVVIDGAICITVVATKGDRVRLGVTTPESVCVDRWEVHQRRRVPGSLSPMPSVSSIPKGESSMRTAQQGDRVQVHYVKRLQDGFVASSRDRAPLELTVGIDHPRLPGLGLALVGLAPGEGATLTVPPERAYGLADPTRIRRCSRQRFPEQATLQPGKWVRFTDGRGRRRLVRILQVSAKAVVVDANHPWAGQALQLEVELLAICGPDAGSEVLSPGREHPMSPATEAASRGSRRPGQARAVAFDVDAASLASLREALPGWEIDRINGATAASLAHAWHPGAADLLVVGIRDNAAITLGLCRFLAFCTPFSTDSRQEETEALGPRPGPRNPARRADAPLLVLVLPGQQSLVGAALDAGAQSCLVLPIHPKEVASMVAHARAGNQPGRHTLNLDQAQTEDRWRDDGGQG